MKHESPQDPLDVLIARWAAEEATADPLVNADPSPAWEQLAPRVTASSPTASRYARRPARAYWPRIAWGSLVAAAAAWFILARYDHTSVPHTFSTAMGSHETIMLSDGTQVTLGPETHLVLSANFARTSRQVDLQGEAIFHVVHDQQHPFAVRTSRTALQDIGTTFDVRSYPTDTSDEVAVAEGAVEVGPVVLHARDVAQFSNAGRVTLRSGANIDPYFGWQQGRLAFDAMPLRDVARDLSRRFDLHITIADSALAGQLVTGTFTDQSVDIILDDITAIVGAQFQRTDRTVVIRHRVANAGSQQTAPRFPLNTAFNPDRHS